MVAPPQALSEVQVPADFSFQTSRSVPVSLTLDTSLVAAGFPASVEVKAADGSVLFEGGITGGSTVSAKVAVPLKDAKLVAVLHAGGTDKSFDLPITSTGGAAATLR